MIFEDDTEELRNIDPGSIDTDEGAAEENEGGSDLAAQEEAVAEARGWRPKDKFSGDPDKWVDAKSFLDRNASLQSEVKEVRELLSRKDEEYADRLRRIEAANERIILNDRQRLVDQLEQAKRQAVELGDTVEYDRIRQEESSYYRRIAQESREQEPPRRETERAPDLLPETQDWIRRNSWFNDSRSMQQIALGFYDEAMEGMPASRDETKRLAYVEKKMAEVYPDKFGRQSGSSSVEGGRRPMAVTSRITSLSAEERAACKRFMSKGIIKDEAEYIKYLNE